MQRNNDQPGRKLRRLGLRAALLSAAACLATSLAGAQAVYAGFQPTHSIWVGAECSWFSASFPYQSGQRVEGCGGFANLRWTSHIDIEGNVRWLPWNDYPQTSERTLLAGPRYIFRRFGKFEPYGKFLVGDGTIHYPYKIGTDSYFALAPGGGVNYRLSRRLTVRAEYEYQIWLNSPGFTNEPKHALHPNGLNVGFAYKVWSF